MAGAVVVVLGLGLVAAVSATLTDLLDRSAKGIEALVGVPLLLVVIAGLAAALYRFSLRRPLRRWELLPGASATAVAVVALLVAFDVYLHLSTHLTAVYGALAGVVLAMLFAYLAIYAMLLGAVVNAQRGEPT
jgi:membrane protein